MTKMDDIHDLYQDLILDHNKRPRNKRSMESPDRTAEGFNPVCGDHITVYVKVENDVVKDVTFQGSGCAISTASASLMTEAIRGKTLPEAKELFKRFHGMLTGEAEVDNDGPGMGKLSVFSGVCKYPARVKCATLAWHTVNAALDRTDTEVVSTE